MHKRVWLVEEGATAFAGENPNGKPVEVAEKGWCEPILIKAP